MKYNFYLYKGPRDLRTSNWLFGLISFWVEELEKSIHCVPYGLKETTFPLQTGVTFHMQKIKKMRKINLKSQYFNPVRANVPHFPSQSILKYNRLQLEKNKNINDLVLIILASCCFPFKVFLRSSELPTMTSVWLNYINSFWLFRKYKKTCFWYETASISQERLSIFW